MDDVSRFPVRRRGVLGGFAAAGAWLLSGTAAQALMPQPGSDYGAILDKACGASLDHKRQIAELERTLGLSLPDERLIGVLQRIACPICGCPLMPPMNGASSF
ncbi:hypothetical protein ACCD06_19800 [Azospirillum sp. CT11-132]|uniref:hypothetical protein n=1 Tax=Azospirillum sp. CT11-132 TaxID=3396317 RepID=UPI0039A75D3C